MLQPSSNREDGRPIVGIDTKSDDSPNLRTLYHDPSRGHACLDMAGAGQRLIVLMTNPIAPAVSPSPQTMSA